MIKKNYRLVAFLFTLLTVGPVRGVIFLVSRRPVSGGYPSLFPSSESLVLCHPTSPVPRYSPTASVFQLLQSLGAKVSWLLALLSMRVGRCESRSFPPRSCKVGRLPTFVLPHQFLVPVNCRMFGLFARPVRHRCVRVTSASPTDPTVHRRVLKVRHPTSGTTAPHQLSHDGRVLRPRGSVSIGVGDGPSNTGPRAPQCVLQSHHEYSRAYGNVFFVV